MKFVGGKFHFLTGHRHLSSPVWGQRHMTLISFVSSARLSKSSPPGLDRSAPLGLSQVGLSCRPALASSCTQVMPLVVWGHRGGIGHKPCLTPPESTTRHGNVYVFAALPGRHSTCTLHLPAVGNWRNTKRCREQTSPTSDRQTSSWVGDDQRITGVEFPYILRGERARNPKMSGPYQ